MAFYGPHTLETRQKISSSLKDNVPWIKGKHHSLEVRKKIGGRVGERSKRWKGNDVGYSGIHKWVAYHLGKPQKCELADKTCSNSFEWANISHEYKRELTDFWRLCASHHRRYDRRIL